MADKAAEKKAPAKKTAVKKTEAAPKTAEKKAPAAKKDVEKKVPAAKKAAAKKAETVLKTILQIDGKDLDISGLAEKALKQYKSVHKRKVVTDFTVYVKPEENAAYFTVNGEGGDDFKIDL